MPLHVVEAVFFPLTGDRALRGIDVGHGLGADHRAAQRVDGVTSPANRVSESWLWRKSDSEMPQSKVISALFGPEIFAVKMPPR